MAERISYGNYVVLVALRAQERGLHEDPGDDVQQCLGRGIRIIIIIIIIIIIMIIIIMIMIIIKLIMIMIMIIMEVMIVTVIINSIVYYCSYY